jgi:hypothetical protein
VSRRPKLLTSGASSCHHPRHCRAHPATLTRLPRPPAPAAGAPPPNSTFFCEPSSNTCFFYNNALANFTSARAFCQGIAPGGDLARWNQPDKQLAAELFFERLGTLTPMYYWTGVRRLNSSANFTFVDGSEVAQAASNSPYAHWNWYQPLAANRSGYDCVMAYSAYRWGLELRSTCTGNQALCLCSSSSNAKPVHL